MKKMKKIETNTSKKPMKRLIALWVVFVMLIVPFANHVGKNDVKAEETGTVNVSTGQKQTVENFIQIFPKTDEDGNVVKGDYSKTVHLLANAQTYTTRIERLDHEGANNFEYGYVVCYDGKVPASEIGIDKITPLTSDISNLSIDNSCTYYIYAKKTSESSYKLQYKLTVQFHDTAFLSDSQISGYVSSIEVNAGISDSIEGTSGIKYFVSTDIAQADVDCKNAGNYTYANLTDVNYADLYGEEVVVYAGLISTESTPRVLEYKKLGTVTVTDDTTAPVIKHWQLVETDTLTDDHGGDQVTNSIHDNVNADHFFEGDVYYGNKPYYYFKITVEDNAGEGQTDATGLPDVGAVTAKCGDKDLVVAKDQGAGYYYTIIVPENVLKSGADNEISYTIKDKKGNENTGTFDIKLHQVTDHTTVESAKFLDDANSDLFNNATAINSTKTVQITIKSTKVVGKVALNDGTTDVFVSTNPTNGEMSAKREATVTADFTIPPEGTTNSTKYSSLNVVVYGTDGSTITQTITKTLKDILFDKTPPTISSPVLQEELDNTGTWNDVTLAADGTYTTKLGGKYRYVVTVKDDANGSGVDENSVKAGAKNFVKDASTGKYIYNILADDYASDSFSLVVQASDKAGNTVQEGTILPTLKKLDEKFRVDDKWILDSDKTTDITSQVTADTTKYSNHQLYLKLKLSSAYAIKKVELHAKDEVYTTLEGAQITNTQDNDTHRYTAVVEFALPKDTNVNELINRLYVTAEDSVSPVLNYPGITPEGNQIFIGSILYDNTHPYATVSTIEDKWYQSYTLDYGIYSGKQSVESNLTKAEYSFNNCAEPTTVSLVQPGSELPTYTGAVDVPESADPTGTLVQFAAEDMCLNNIEGTTAYRIKVDKQAPKIQFQVNGKNIFTNPIEGNVAIATAVSDNLTIAKATITVTKPDGSSVVKELCSNVIGSQTVSNNYTLDNLLGTKAADGAYTVTVNVADMSGRTASQTITFKVDNTIPVVTAKISDGVTAGKQLGKNFDGTDCDYFYRSNVTALLTYEDDNLAQSMVVV